MRKQIILLIAITAMLSVLSGMAIADPSFFGISGNILTPDDTVLAPGDFSADFHYISMTHEVTTESATVGVVPNLEVGVGGYHSQEPGVGSKLFINAKYRVLQETATMPSITVGVLDATGQIDTNADPGGFLVIGKSLTSFATDLADQPISPLRGYIGVGNGLLSGPFAGVEWQFTPKTSLMAEYINKVRMNGGIDTSTVFNIGARFGITDEIKADVSWLDLKDLGVGIVYTKAVEL